MSLMTAVGLVLERSRLALLWPIFMEQYIHSCSSTDSPSLFFNGFTNNKKGCIYKKTPPMCELEIRFWGKIKLSLFASFHATLVLIQQLTSCMFDFVAHHRIFQLCISIIIYNELFLFWKTLKNSFSLASKEIIITKASLRNIFMFITTSSPTAIEQS